MYGLTRLPGGTRGKEPVCNAGEIRNAGLISGLGGSLGGGLGNPLQDPCLENPMERGLWQTMVHRTTKRQT